jgi:hypothetical protein
VRKPESKKPLGRPRRRWVHNIKMDLGEMVWVCRDWIDQAHDRDKWWPLVCTVMKLVYLHKMGSRGASFILKTPNQ